MYRQHLVKASLAGLVSGTALGLLLKFIERATDVKVYTLLLNIDYIPLLNQTDWPEIAEFLLHLAVSAGLGILLQLYLQSKKWSAKKSVSFTMLASFLVGLFLYPTTALSDRTPALTSVSALLLWLTGHVLYGGLLGILLLWSGRTGRSGERE